MNIKSAVKIYTLEFTQDEIDTLYMISQKIGGSPTDSRRKLFSQLNDKLKDHISRRATETNPFDYGKRDSIYFEEEDDLL